MIRTRSRQPTHPGQVLKADVLDELGLTITAAARHLGVSRTRQEAFVEGQAPCSPNLAHRIARATRTSIQSWLAMQIASDVWQAEHHPLADIEAIQPF
jgi:addiction module HigA family antidote